LGGADSAVLHFIQGSQIMKYFKSKSLTWWTGISYLAIGTILSVHAAYNLGKRAMSWW